MREDATFLFGNLELYLLSATLFLTQGRRTADTREHHDVIPIASPRALLIGVEVSRLVR
jgi:hypothetical protein